MFHGNIIRCPRGAPAAVQVVMTAVQTTGRALQLAPLEFRKDREVGACAF